jgi:hypothetical protein
MITTIPSFAKMLDLVPAEIRELLEKCAQTPQSPTWHPEGDVFKHIQIVYERARKTGSINIAIAALFHDLGKVESTKPNKHGSWSSYGHEFISAKLVDAHKQWIGSMGAQFMRVREIVENHMRIKLMAEMKPSKQEALRSHRSYDDLLIFSECDNMKTLTSDEINGIFAE